jgi:hypothetical protein
MLCAAYACCLFILLFFFPRSKKETPTPQQPASIKPISTPVLRLNQVDYKP